MPRSRKNTLWMVAVGGRLINNIRSKTYLGACYKAFKKLKIDPPPLAIERVSRYWNPITVQYDKRFKDVYCIVTNVEKN